MHDEVELFAVRPSLGWLLHPVAVEEFLRTSWEREPLLISRGQQDYFEDLPGLDDVEELITTTIPGHRFGIGPNGLMRSDDRLVRSDRSGSASQREFSMTADGIPDIQDIYRSYHEGYTIVLNALHRRSSKVANLARALEAVLHHPVGVNLYLTPRHGQGFGLHADTHDVFILQLHGTKEWHVAESGGRLPLPRESPEQPPDDTPLRTMTLQSGDSLYIPRGHAHRAATTSTSALHLTVGVHTFSWTDLLTEALRLVAAQDAEFREALPPGFLGREIDPKRVAGLSDRLARALADEPLVRQARENLGTQLTSARKAAPGGHIRSLDGVAQLTGESVVRRIKTMYQKIQKGSAQISIEFDGNWVSGPLFLEDALLFIAEHECFQVRELPEISDFPETAKTDLVSRLIREGFLVLADNNQEGNSHAT